MESELIRKEKIAADAYSFYFKKPTDYNFKPGQYLKMEIKIDNPDVRGNSRLFTIASSPAKEHLIITTRVIRSSFKKTLEKMEIRTKIKISCPYGTFVLDENEKRQHIFLAGGIGITPFYSMITYAVDKKLGIPMTLFASSRTPEDIVFGQELKEIAKTHSWLKLVETITRPEESKTPWTGLTGRIDANLIQNSLPLTEPSAKWGIFYISGPSAMVDALFETVKSLNVPVENIKIEKFTGY